MSKGKIKTPSNLLRRFNNIEAELLELTQTVRRLDPKDQSAEIQSIVASMQNLAINLGNLSTNHAMTCNVMDGLLEVLEEYFADLPFKDDVEKRTRIFMQKQKEAFEKQNAEREEGTDSGTPAQEGAADGSELS